MFAKQQKSSHHNLTGDSADISGSAALPRDWSATSVLVGFPIFAIVAVPIYVHFNGVHPMEVVTFLIFSLATAFGITMGYHRLFAHRTFDTGPVLKWVFLIFGAFSLQYPARSWVLDHRIHHQRTDSEIDPHNATRGFWYSHFKWLLFERRPDRDYSLVNDLSNDSLVMWQERHYLILALLSLLLPAAIGYFYERPFGFFLWGGILRVVFIHHCTFLVNSWAHWAGTKSFDDGTTSRDSIFVAVLTMGEGYHNFHHRFPGDYRNGARWCHWDPTKWLIYCLSIVGLTKNLRRAPAALIESERQRAIKKFSTSTGA